MYNTDAKSARRRLDKADRICYTKFMPRRAHRKFLTGWSELRVTVPWKEKDGSEGYHLRAVRNDGKEVFVEVGIDAGFPEEAVIRSLGFLQDALIELEERHLNAPKE